MSEGNSKMVKCTVGLKKCFSMKVGLHQGLALSPFLFVIAKDRLTNEIREKSKHHDVFRLYCLIWIEQRRGGGKTWQLER